jgi:hypothetical protein
MFRIAPLILLAFCSTALADTIPKADRNPVKVEGTTWEGQDSLGSKWKFTFEKDGVLKYFLESTKSNASWKQSGKTLYLECNNKYCEFDGTVDKQQISLEGHNVTGLKWQVTIRPVKYPQK